MELLYERAWGDYDTDYVFFAAAVVTLVGLGLLVDGARRARAGGQGRVVMALLGIGGAATVGGAAWLGWAALFGWTASIAWVEPGAIVVRSSGLLGLERRFDLDYLARAHHFADPVERGAPMRVIVVDAAGSRHDLIKVYGSRAERLEPLVSRIAARVPIVEAPPGATPERVDAR
jgi:hypothetical protein